MRAKPDAAAPARLARRRRPSRPAGAHRSTKWTQWQLFAMETRLPRCCPNLQLQSTLAKEVPSVGNQPEGWFPYLWQHDIWQEEMVPMIEDYGWQGLYILRDPAGIFMPYGSAPRAHGTRFAVCKLPEHATACYQTFIQWNHLTWVLVSTPCTGLCDGRVSKQ